MRGFVKAELARIERASRSNSCSQGVIPRVDKHQVPSVEVPLDSMAGQALIKESKTILIRDE